VELEQAAEPLATVNGGYPSWSWDRACGEQQQIALTLMVSFMVKMVEIIGDRTP
jgi:hypothetical protein